MMVVMVVMVRGEMKMRSAASNIVASSEASDRTVRNPDRLAGLPFLFCAEVLDYMLLYCLPELFLH